MIEGEVGGRSYTFDIMEWWTEEGRYEGRDSEYHHEGEPDEEQLLEAVRMTGHITYDDGEDFYYTLWAIAGPGGGWTLDELAAEVDNAAEYGTP